MSEAAIRDETDAGARRADQTEAALWTGLGLVTPLHARVNGGVPKGAASGVSIDTRTLRRGGTSRVESLCSTIAGPAKRVPGTNVSRA